MATHGKTNPVGVILAKAGAALMRLRPVWQRAVQWQLGKVRLLAAWLPAHRRAATIGGIGAALAVTLLLAGIPGGSPERQVQRQALSGKELFAALGQQHAGIQRASRVEEGAERGARTNLVVLTETVWQDLAQDQRNSIGSWLNTMGGSWEIRVGKASSDGARVLDAEAVITSRQWNQQLK